MNHRLAAFAIAAALIVGMSHAAEPRRHVPAACGSDCADESEPFLKAAALVNPALLSGPDFKVVPEVPVHGYMADFLIDTPYGPLHADSVEMLELRIAELPAVETLDRASQSGAFARALGERGRKTGAAVLHVFAHPVDTLVGLPAGVVRYLRLQIDTWGHRAQSLADQTSRHAENSGSPFQAPDGPMTAARDGIAQSDRLQPPPKNRAWYARIGSESEREARRYLKYGQQRRELARMLGIDPDTSNPLVNERLDALAWAAVAGNFSAGEALASVTGTAASVIGTSGQLDRYVLQQTPGQLRETMQKRLRALCSDDESIRSFLHRGAFTDTLRLQLTDALAALAPQSGCNEVIELAATTRSEVEARYLVDTLALIRRDAVPAHGALIVAGAAVAWRGDDARLVLPLPVDYLTWSHDIDDFLDQPVFAAADKTVLIGGQASMRAQRGLTERGWNLRLRQTQQGQRVLARVAAPDDCAARCAPGRSAGGTR